MAQIVVRLAPRAGRDEISGWQGGVLHVRVTAPPIDGRANAALLRLIADAAGVPQRDVRIVSGESARIKRLAVEHVTQDELDKHLGKS